MAISELAEQWSVRHLERISEDLLEPIRSAAAAVDFETNRFTRELPKTMFDDVARNFADVERERFLALDAVSVATRDLPKTMW